MITGVSAKPRLDLGKAIQEYMDTPATGLIGTRALPIFKTAKKAASFPAITRESILRTVDNKRNARSAYQQDGYDTEDKTYSCLEYGLEHPIDDSERELYAEQFDADLMAARIASAKNLRAQEIRIAAKLFNTTTFTGAALYTDDSASPWDSASSLVIAQISAAKAIVRQNCGMIPNTLIFSWANIERLVGNTEIKDAIKYNQMASETAIINALSALFNIPNILIAGGVKNTALEGQTFSGSDIWSDDYALLCVTANNPQDLSEPCLGRTMLWVSDSAENEIVEQYRNEAIRSDIFRVRHCVDEVLVDPYFGHLLKIDA